MQDAEASRGKTRLLLENKKQNTFVSKNNIEFTRVSWNKNSIFFNIYKSNTEFQTHLLITLQNHQIPKHPPFSLSLSQVSSVKLVSYLSISLFPSTGNLWPLSNLSHQEKKIQFTNNNNNNSNSNSNSNSNNNNNNNNKY